ncbi:uncharacterized protein LOC129220479 [Uloborus diversus]|uniref:uncharacterized protein LOC129220479 n=1 Tax=Uloborus diversus TaxID=327109 RepID=UPI002409B6B8|nr:uncharacterized protein LOC129220479 [Uloborus diversus]
MSDVPPEVPIDEIRNAAISRRGGIRVRGGSDSSDFQNAKQVETKGQRDSRRERGRGRGNKCIVQTEGTFLGQGPAARVKKESLDTEYERAPRGSRAAGKQGAATFDRKPDEKEIKYLLEPWDEDENFDDSGELCPVILPLKPKSESKCKIKKEPLDDVDVKKEVKDGDIKVEPGADKWHALEGKFFASIAPEDKKKENLIDLVDSTKVTGDSILLLFQMPQRMPFGNTDCHEKEQPAATSKATTSQAKDNEKEEVKDSKPTTLFDDMSDGRIGKLQVLKSGKMRLVMGSFMFTLETGSNSESLMEAVSIRTKDENDGDIVVLGKIERSMIVSPSDDLLNPTSTVDTKMS